MTEKESGAASERGVTCSAEASSRADRDPTWQVFFCGALYLIAVYVVVLELEPITGKAVDALLIAVLLAAAIACVWLRLGGQQVLFLIASWFACAVLAVPAYVLFVIVRILIGPTRFVVP